MLIKTVYWCLVVLQMSLLLDTIQCSPVFPRITSSVSASGRSHACPGETVLITCELEGSYLAWIIDSEQNRVIFGGTANSVDDVQTFSYLDSRAILTGNDVIPGNTVMKRLKSTLMINPVYHNTEVDNMTLLHNISCLSYTYMQEEYLRIAEQPNSPSNVQVKQSKHSKALLVTWTAPNNSHHYDLEYYRVQAFADNGQWNGTSIEPKYLFDIDPQHHSNIHVEVTAVSRCSQKSIETVNALQVNEETLLTTQMTTLYKFTWNSAHGFYVKWEMAISFTVVITALCINS